MPKRGSFGEIRGAVVDEGDAPPALAAGFADGEEASVVLAAFLAASLAASGETHVLGGDE